MFSLAESKHEEAESKQRILQERSEEIDRLKLEVCRDMVAFSKANARMCVCVLCVDVEEAGRFIEC